MSTKCKHNVNICKQNVNILSTFSKEQCQYCKKTFNTRQSRWRHEKKSCKKKNEILEKKERDFEKDKIIEKLLTDRKNLRDTIREELKKEMKLKNENSNNLNDQMLELEFKLNPFSETDRSHFKDSDYLMAIKKGNLGIAHIIQKLHFNEAKPENHNICMTNMKNNLVKIYTKKDEWEYKLGNEVINFLVEDNANIIEDKIAEWKKVNSDEEDSDSENKTDRKREPKHKYGKERYKTTLEKFPRLLDRLSKSSYVQKLVHDEVKLVLYNKRKYALEKEKMMRRKLF